MGEADWLIRTPVLEYLGVNPEFRRRGVGETLVAWGIKQADEKGIHVCCKL